MTLGQKIRQLRTSQNLSQKALGQLIGTTSATINRYEKDLRNPKLPVICRLAEVLQSNLDFLLGSSDFSLPSEESGQEPLSEESQIWSYEEMILQIAHLGHCFTLQFRGQEMEPQLFDQDLLIVQTQDDCENGDIAVILIQRTQISVRRIHKTPEGLLLLPNNPACMPTFYTKQQIHNLPVQILGRVIELRRRFDK